MLECPQPHDLLTKLCHVNMITRLLTAQRDDVVNTNCISATYQDLPRPRLPCERFFESDFVGERQTWGTAHVYDSLIRKIQLCEIAITTILASKSMIDALSAPCGQASRPMLHFCRCQAVTANQSRVVAAFGFDQASWKGRSSKLVKRSNTAGYDPD